MLWKQVFFRRNLSTQTKAPHPRVSWSWSIPGGSFLTANIQWWAHIFADCVARLLMFGRFECSSMVVGQQSLWCVVVLMDFGNEVM